MRRQAIVKKKCFYWFVNTLSPKIDSVIQIVFLTQILPVKEGSFSIQMNFLQMQPQGKFTRWASSFILKLLYSESCCESCIWPKLSKYPLVVSLGGGQIVLL